MNALILHLQKKKMFLFHQIIREANPEDYIMYLLMYKMNKSGTFSDIWGLSKTYKHNIIKSKDDLEATLGKLKNEEYL